MLTALASFDPALLDAWNTELQRHGAEALLLAEPALAGPPDPIPWSRAASEVALTRWLLLPSAHAADAFVDEAGGPGGPTLRIAAIDEAAELLRELGRQVDIRAASLGDLLARLGPRLGRRQRVLAPHVAGGGKLISERLEALGAEPICVAAYDYEESVAVEHPTRLVAIATTVPQAESLAPAMRRAEADRAVLVTLGAASASAAEDSGAPQIREVGALPETLEGLLDELRTVW